MSDNTFKVMMTLAKSFERKSADGSSHMVITGLASGLNIDRQHDRMAKSAIEAFKKAIDEGIVLPDNTWSLIPLRTGHRAEWNDILGWITKAEIDDSYNLWIEAELDEQNATSQNLFAKLTQGSRPGKPLQLGLSVGGKIKKASYEWNHELQKKVQIIEDVVLNEVSVVGNPANPITYVEALAKSIDWDEIIPPVEEILLNKKESSMSASENVTATETVDTTTTNETQEASSTTVEKTASGVSAEVVTDPQTAATDTIVSSISSLQSEVARLTDVVTRMQNVPTSESTAKSDTSSEVKADEKLEKATPSDDSMRTMIEGLFEKFKVDVIDPLTKQLELTKAAVADLEAEPQDKSVALAKSKGTETLSALDAYTERMAKARELNEPVSIIGEAVKYATMRS